MTLDGLPMDRFLLKKWLILRIIFLMGDLMYEHLLALRGYCVNATGKINKRRAASSTHFSSMSRAFKDRDEGYRGRRWMLS